LSVSGGSTMSAAATAARPTSVHVLDDDSDGDVQVRGVLDCINASQGSLCRQLLTGALAAHHSLCRHQTEETGRAELVPASSSHVKVGSLQVHLCVAGTQKPSPERADLLLVFSHAGPSRKRRRGQQTSNKVSLLL